jgi:hypothetical protein
MVLYKVKVLRVPGINNKTYTPFTKTVHGVGIVSDDMFPEGNAAELCKKSYLEKITDKKQEAKEKKDREKALRTAVVDAEDKLEEAKKALKDSDEEDTAALDKAVEDAEFALEVAKEALENL